MKRLSLNRRARQVRRDARARTVAARQRSRATLLQRLARWLLRRRPEEPVEPRAPTLAGRSNPMKLPARRDRFTAALAEVRRLFPNASEDFLRDNARAVARAVPVAKKARAPRPYVKVAQTYRTPTRAERQDDHRKEMDERGRCNRNRRRNS